MRNLDHARARARAVRQTVGSESPDLLERTTGYIRQRHRRILTPLAPTAMRGSRAEVKLGSPLLRYDKELDTTPEEKLFVVAHELGHLELHDRLSDPSVPPDPLLASAYMGSGAPGVARYSEKAKEESEANAFATEYLCPAPEALAEWLEGEAPAAIAKRRGIPLRLVQAQLAEALFGLGAADGAPPGHGPEREPTEAQKDAARDFGRAVLVTAGPGTGKSRTLVLRLELLLERGDVRPSDILVLTFSNEAAEELRARVAARFTAEVADKIEVCTFHTWGYVFLHHFRQEAGFDGDRELVLLDDAARAELVAQVLPVGEADAILDLKDPDKTAQKVADYIGYLKDRLWTPDDLATRLDDWIPVEGEEDTRAEAAALLSVYRAYEEERKRCGAVDFGDLILLPVQILKASQDLRDRVAAKHRWVLVDEYQDVSRAVAELLTQICGPDNLPWVVGDKRQAIYRFRGAHPGNVDQFGDDFPGAFTHELDVNFRSGDAVVVAANHLAALLEDPEFEGEAPALWRANRDRPPVAAPAVAIAAANSDAAERQGIARQVKAWVDAGVPKSSIAVLARRNVDVRQVALALNRTGVRAVTSGVVTAEGAAGDLAAVVALSDAPRAALPRLAYALFRAAVPPAALNAAIRHMLDGMDARGRFEVRSVPGADGVVEEMARLRAELEPLTFEHDGWEVLCGFLFGHGRYLRDLVRRADDPEAALAIEEIVTVLAAAAAHRYTHPNVQPRISRIGFGQRLRSVLAQAAPSVAPPPPKRDAVRVMTCHASKGLEFPYVVVAGQTLSPVRGDDAWLPPGMRRDPEDDARQADALLFVGLTRAERAAVVSYASSAGGTTQARHQRSRPLLLERWAERSGVPRLDWTAERAEKETFSATGLWGGIYPRLVSAYVVSGAGCAVRSYLQESLGAEFPIASTSLWPAYVGITRRAMQGIVRAANAAGRPLPPSAALALLDEDWADIEGREHPFLATYRRYAERRVMRFAAAYEPVAGAEDLASEVQLAVDGGARMVRTDLLGYFRLSDGRRRAIGLEEDSLAGVVREDDGTLNWTNLGRLKVPFSLLHTATAGDLEIFVYSDADGCIYSARWSKQKASMTRGRTAAEEQVRRGIAGQVEAAVKPYTCGTCRHLVHCPHWMGAAETPS